MTPMNDKVEDDVTGRTDPTPEMVRVGVKEFYSFDERFEEASDVIVRIWRAMKTAAVKT